MSITHLIHNHLTSLAKICALCGQYHRKPHAVCDFCQTLLIPLGPRCLRCAKPKNEPPYHQCRACRTAHIETERVIAAYRYHEPLRGLLHRFKYQQELYLASFLVYLMEHADFDPTATDCLIPVPTHRKRLQQRGYNQTMILAKKLSKKYHIPYLPHYCKKIIHSTPQAHLDRQQRRSNLIDAFVATSIPYSRVTLIDDLYTTGSTANEIARTLKKQGVSKVDIWCCARVT